MSTIRLLVRGAVSVLVLHSLIALAADAALPEPVFEGHPVSFWLDELPFVDVDETGQNSEKGYPEFYANLAEAEAHQKRIEGIRKKAPKAIQALGTNALPSIWPRLKSQSTPGESGQRITDPVTGVKKEVSGRVFRGQAIEALILLKKHRKAIEPTLVEITGDRKQSKVVRGAAFYALKQLADENEAKYKDLLRQE